MAHHQRGLRAELAAILSVDQFTLEDLVDDVPPPYEPTSTRLANLIVHAIHHPIEARAVYAFLPVLMLRIFGFTAGQGWLETSSQLPSKDRDALLAIVMPDGPLHTFCKHASMFSSSSSSNAESKITSQVVNHSFTGVVKDMKFEFPLSNLPFNTRNALLCRSEFQTQQYQSYLAPLLKPMLSSTSSSSSTTTITNTNLSGSNNFDHQPIINNIPTNSSKSVVTAITTPAAIDNDIDNDVQLSKVLLLDPLTYFTLCIVASPANKYASDSVPEGTNPVTAKRIKRSTSLPSTRALYNQVLAAYVKLCTPMQRADVAPLILPVVLDFLFLPWALIPSSSSPWNPVPSAACADAIATVLLTLAPPAPEALELQPGVKVSAYQRPVFASLPSLTTAAACYRLVPYVIANALAMTNCSHEHNGDDDDDDDDMMMMVNHGNQNSSIAPFHHLQNVSQSSLSMASLSFNNNNNATTTTSTAITFTPQALLAFVRVLAVHIAPWRSSVRASLRSMLFAKPKSTTNTMNTNNIASKTSASISNTVFKKQRFFGTPTPTNTPTPANNTRSISTSPFAFLAAQLSAVHRSPERPANATEPRWRQAVQERVRLVDTPLLIRAIKRCAALRVGVLVEGAKTLACVTDAANGARIRYTPSISSSSTRSMESEQLVLCLDSLRTAICGLDHKQLSKWEAKNFMATLISIVGVKMPSTFSSASVLKNISDVMTTHLPGTPQQPTNQYSPRTPRTTNNNNNNQASSVRRRRRSSSSSGGTLTPSSSRRTVGGRGGDSSNSNSPMSVLDSKRKSIVEDTPFLGSVWERPIESGEFEPLVIFAYWLALKLEPRIGYLPDTRFIGRFWFIATLFLVAVLVMAIRAFITATA